MAFLKEKEEKFGQKTQYHRLVRAVNLMLREGESFPSRIYYESYLSEESRKNNGEHEEKMISVQLPKEYRAIILKALYGALSEVTDEFADATDHMESDDPNILGLLNRLKEWELGLSYYEIQRIANERGFDLTKYEADYNAMVAAQS